MTLEQYLIDLGLVKETDSGKVEWDSNSLQSIMQIDVAQLLQERGAMPLPDVTAMQATSGQETNQVIIDQVGYFLFRDTGTPNYTTIFPAAGAGVWVKQTGTVGGVAWGAITGMLGNQTDLQAALNAKVPTTRTVNGHALSTNVTVTKGDVGLGSVENTALSTWSGSPNITTVGTVVTGDWHGNIVDIQYGGTGHSTADGAINALLPVQIGQSGKFLATNGSVSSWETVTSLATIYTADGTVATTRTVTADTGVIDAGTGILGINNPNAGEFQLMGIKDSVNGYNALIYIRPLLDPNDNSTSPVASISITDSDGVSVYQNLLQSSRDSIAIMQAKDTAYRQLVMSSLLTRTVYDDSSGYPIAYSSNILVANFDEKSLISREYTDTVFIGGTAIFTPNGTNNFFDINIGTGVTTDWFNVTPMTSVAAATHWSEETAPGNIRVTFSTPPPPAGANTIKFSWSAKRAI